MHVVSFLPGPDFDHPPSQCGIIRIDFGYMHMTVCLIKDQQLQESFFKGFIELGDVCFDVTSFGVERFVADQLIGEFLPDLFFEGAFVLFGHDALQDTIML